ncbi:MAG: amidohydrolase family protein, partial [Burkholderiaceae bacterium]
MERLLIDNVRPFDSRRGMLGAPSRIVIDDGRIAEVTSEPRKVDTARRIDGGGRVALPGLIDAHVHVTATMHDLMGQALKPPSLVVAESSRILRDMLQRGFTTVRDAAGA